MIPISASNQEDRQFKVSMYTKLMENYNEVPAARMPSVRSGPESNSGYISSVCSCLDATDVPVVIANRGDGRLIKFSLDRHGEAGFIPEYLDAAGEKAVLGLGSDHRCYLFAIENGKAWFSVETRPGSGEFGEKNVFELSPAPDGPPMKIIARSLGDSLCVCVIYNRADCPEQAADLYCNTDFREDNSSLDLEAAQYIAVHETIDYALISDKVYWITQSGSTITYVDIETSEYSYYNFPQRTVLTAMRWTPWKGDKGCLVGILEKDNKYYYGVIEHKNQGVEFREFYELPEECTLEVCELDDGNNPQIHVLLSGRTKIYHAFIEDVDGQLTGSYPMPIGNSGGKASFINSIRDYVEFYLPAPVASGVVQMCKTSDGSYTSRTLHIIGSGDSDIIVTPCYSTELQFTDPEGAPLINQAVTLWALDNVYLECDTGTHRVGPENHILLKTDALGKITIVQHTDSISSVTICCRLQGLMTYDETIFINPQENVSRYLEGLTAAELAAAKKNNGEWLLPPEYRSETEAGKLLTAIQTMLSAAALRSRELGSVGAYFGNANTPRGVNSVSAGFLLSSSPGGGPELANIGIDEFHARVNAGIANGYERIISNVGDVCQGITSECLTVDTISVCENQVMFEMSDASRKLLYTGSLVDEYQALDSVAAILSKAGVTFNGFFSWVGFIFDWKDFLRAKQGIDYILGKAPAYLKAQISGIKEKANDFLDEMEEKGHSELQKLKTFADGKSIYSKVEGDYPENKQLTQENSNNFVLQKTLKYCGENNASFSSSAMNNFGGAVQDLLEALADYDDSISKKPEYNALSSFVSRNYGTSKDVRGVTFDDMIDAVDAVLGIVFGGLKNITGLACDAVEATIDALLELVTAELYIPIISKLYKKKTGNVLCIRDIITLLTSITSTIMYKFLFSAAPIASDAELNAFKSFVDARFSGTAYAASNDALGFKNFAKLVAVGANAGAWVFETVDEATEDLGESPIDIGKDTMGFLSKAVYLCEGVSMASSLLVIIDDGEAGDFVLAGYDALVLILDIAISRSESRYVTKTGIGVIETVFTGLVRLLLLGIVCLSGVYSNIYDRLSVCVNSACDIMKFLMPIRNPKVRMVVICVDAVCAGIDITLGVLDAVQTEESECHIAIEE